MPSIDIIILNIQKVKYLKFRVMPHYPSYWQFSPKCVPPFFICSGILAFKKAFVEYLLYAYCFCYKAKKEYIILPVKRRRKLTFKQVIIFWDSIIITKNREWQKSKKGYRQLTNILMKNFKKTTFEMGREEWEVI